MHGEFIANACFIGTSTTIYRRRGSIVRKKPYYRSVRLQKLSMAIRENWWAKFGRASCVHVQWQCLQFSVPEHTFFWARFSFVSISWRHVLGNFSIWRENGAKRVNFLSFKWFCFNFSSKPFVLWAISLEIDWNVAFNCNQLHSLPLMDHTLTIRHPFWKVAAITRSYLRFTQDDNDRRMATKAKHFACHTSVMWKLVFGWFIIGSRDYEVNSVDFPPHPH